MDSMHDHNDLSLHVYVDVSFIYLSLLTNNVNSMH